MPELIEVIRDQLVKRKARMPPHTERVDNILERNVEMTIQDRLNRLDGESELTCVPLSKEQCTGNLPKQLQELAYRLSVPRELGTKGKTQDEFPVRSTIADECDSQLKQTIHSFMGVSRSVERDVPNTYRLLIVKHYTDK